MREVQIGEGTGRDGTGQRDCWRQGRGGEEDTECRRGRQTGRRRAGAVGQARGEGGEEEVAYRCRGGGGRRRSPATQMRGEEREEAEGRAGGGGGGGGGRVRGGPERRRGRGGGAEEGMKRNRAEHNDGWAGVWAQDWRGAGEAGAGTGAEGRSCQIGQRWGQRGGAVRGGAGRRRGKLGRKRQGARAGAPGAQGPRIAGAGAVWWLCRRAAPRRMRRFEWGGAKRLA